MTPEESGWLVERHDNGIEYLYVDSTGFLNWTQDSGGALRFARQRDAESMIAIVDDADCTAEHQWG